MRLVTALTYPCQGTRPVAAGCFFSQLICLLLAYNPPDVRDTGPVQHVILEYTGVHLNGCSHL